MALMAAIKMGASSQEKALGKRTSAFLWTKHFNRIGFVERCPSGTGSNRLEDRECQEIQHVTNVYREQ